MSQGRASAVPDSLSPKTAGPSPTSDPAADPASDSTSSPAPDSAADPRQAVPRRSWVGRRVSVIARALRLHLSARLADLGLDQGRYVFLTSLLRRDGCSQDDLARRLYVDKACTARALGRLEADGWVRREAVESNRRMNRLLVTEAGAELAPRIFSVLTETGEQLLDGFDEDEKARFLAMLKRVEANARRLRHDAPSRAATPPAPERP